MTFEQSCITNVTAVILKAAGYTHQNLEANPQRATWAVDEAQKILRELYVSCPEFQKGVMNMASIVVIDGKEIDYDAFVHMMDDDIREELHSKLAPCTDQVFADAYMISHREKYGENYRWG